MTGLVLGIDPGLTGALAFYDPATGDLDIVDVPTVTQAGRRRVNDYSLAREIDARAETVVGAWIEQVHAMPRQGVTSSFSFGHVTGLLRGLVVANLIPLSFVQPNVWKRSLGVPAEKAAARARASQLMPRHAHLWQRARDDGRAEAAMIAVYGARQQATAPP